MDSNASFAIAVVALAVAIVALIFQFSFFSQHPLFAIDMPSGFNKSDEGTKAYQDIGRAYDLTLADEHHERFLKQTQASQHSGKAKTEIIKIRRVMADDGKEYLVYDVHLPG